MKLETHRRLKEATIKVIITVIPVVIPAQHNIAEVDSNSLETYEVPFSLYGEPGFSRVFARFAARKHGGLISYF